MKRLLFLLVLVITLVSCNSTSGKLQPSKVETAIQEKKLIKFRAKEIWFSDILLKYNSNTYVELLELDPMYKIGDTIEIVDRMGIDHNYVLID